MGIRAITDTLLAMRSAVQTNPLTTIELTAFCEALAQLEHDTGTSLQNRVSVDPQFQEIDEIVLIALRRSGDNVQISKYFGLDEWKEVTQGHTEEAARRIIDCFKNNSIELNLYGLALTSLPPLPAQLHALYCYSNQLTSLPQLPAQLLGLNCSDNPLLSFPDGVERLAYFRHDGVNIEVQVSDVIFDEFNRAAPDFTHFDRESLKSDTQFYSNLCTWLNKLTASGEYRKEESRPFFASRVLSILKLAAEDEPYREILKAFLIEALSSCVDRASLPLNYLEVQKAVIESKDGSLENLLKILKGGLALQELDKFAAGFMQQHLSADEVEVYLGFQLQLKEALALPIALKEMAYFGCSSISTQDIESAKRTVEGKLADTALFASYLTQQPIFHKRILQEYSQEYQTHIQPYYDQLEILSAKIQNEEIDDKDFLEQSQAIKAQTDQAEKAFVLKKTNELLRMSRTRLCTIF